MSLTTTLVFLSTLAPAQGESSQVTRHTEVVHGPSPHETPVDPIPSLLAQVSGERIHADVEKLVSFHTRHTLSQTESDTVGIGAARRWLAEELNRISMNTGGRLEVHTQSHERSVKRRAQPAVDVEVVNVYGFLPGRVQAIPPRTVIVSGHYDSIPGDFRDPEGFAPGADDDASGTAVVLELARVLSGHEFDANIVFLLVAGEEQGLWGSTSFAEHCVEEGIDVAAMITNDIVGGIEGGNGVVDAHTVRCFSDAEGLHSPSRELARTMHELAGRYLDDIAVKLVFRLDRFGRGGDHKPFHERGFAAVRMTEANEHYSRQHKNVVTEGDRLEGDLSEHVDPAYCGRVARVNAATVASLALAPPPPTGVRLRAALRYDTEVTWKARPGGDYVVVWRDTTAPTWEHRSEVVHCEGEAGLLVVDGVTADSCFFGVRAVSALGHESLTVLPRRP